MMIGLGLGLTMQRGGGGFSPAALFANGEQGAWFDPSDMATLFQDAAGTIPVTGMEQPVGRELDKSGRGRHRAQAVAASRPTLTAQGMYFDAVDDVIVGPGDVLPLGVSMSHFAVIAPTASAWLLNAGGGPSPIGPVGDATPFSVSLGHGSPTFHRNGAAPLTSRGAVLSAFASGVSILECRSMTRSLGSEIWIGGYPSFRYSGTVAEEIYCTTEAANTNREQIMSYLAAKWGVTL